MGEQASLCAQPYELEHLATHFLKYNHGCPGTDESTKGRKAHPAFDLVSTLTSAGCSFTTCDVDMMDIYPGCRGGCNETMAMKHLRNQLC